MRSRIPPEVDWNTQFDTGVPLAIPGMVIVLTEDRDTEVSATQFGVQYDLTGVEVVRTPVVNHTCAIGEDPLCFEWLRGNRCRGSPGPAGTGGGGDLAAFVALGLSGKARATIRGLTKGRPVDGYTLLELSSDPVYTVMSLVGGQSIVAAPAVPGTTFTFTVLARGNPPCDEAEAPVASPSNPKPGPQRRLREHRSEEEIGWGIRVAIGLLVVGVLALYGAIIWNMPWWWSR